MDEVAHATSVPVDALGTGRLWRRWVVANAWAEALGLGLSAGAAVLLVSSAGGSVLATVGGAALVVLVAGLAEGGVVGLAQHGVLRRALPALPARRWIGATVVGALVAWTLGMVPSTLMAVMEVGNGQPPAIDPPLLLQLTFAVALGLVAGPILGGAQAFVLRDHVWRAWRWLPANAAAWAVGMPLVFLVAGGMPPTWHPTMIVAVGLLMLLAVGAVVGAIHGAVLVRLLDDPRPDDAVADQPEVT